MSTDKTATFGIRVKAEGTEEAKQLASSVEGLKKQIEDSQARVKAYGSSLRNLRGSSDEVKDAKTRLKAAVNAERDAISQNVLALGKHGKNLADVTQKTKAAKLPVDALKSSMSDLKGVLGGLGVLAVAATFVALGEAVYGATESLVGFVLENSNLLRTQGLLREAATGSESNARAFGNQIDALSDKIPTARNELQELALDISKSMVGTRVSGQGIVDTFNAIGQESAAMGKQAGSAIQSLIERGKLMGRFGLGVNELTGGGTGLQFNDVAGALAKHLKIGLKDAQNQLVFGRVKIDDAAKALRDAVETKFAKVNLQQMLDLNVIWKKFRDNLTRLTSGVKLQPILEGVQRLSNLFSESTVTGHALQTAITGFGQILGLTFEKGVPIAEQCVKRFVLQILKWEIVMLKNKQTITNLVATALGKLPSLDSALKTLRLTVDILAGAFLALGLRAVASLGPIGILAGIIAAEVYYIIQGIKGIDFNFLGAQILKGFKTLLSDFSWLGQAIASGLASAWGAVSGAVANLANRIKDGFKGALGIHSPSKVFEGYGRNTVEGYTGGIEKKAPSAERAVTRIGGARPSPVLPQASTGGARPSPVLPQASAKSGQGAGNVGNVSLNVVLNTHFPGVKNGADVADALSGPSFRARVTQVFEEMLIGAGVPVQTPQSQIT